MIRIVSDGYEATVAFPYDPPLVDIVRGVPGRRWSPERKVWIIDSRDLEGLVTAYHRAGQTVTVNGEVRKPPPPFRHEQVHSDSPVITFVAAMPDRLRAPICRALAKVLHPDVGGDVELMKQLNRAKELYAA